MPSPAADASGAGAVREPQLALTGRAFLAPPIIAACAAVVTVVVAASANLPIRDPDAKLVGSPLLLIGLIAFVFFLLDLLPRALWRARSSPLAFHRRVLDVLRERWTLRRALIVVVTLVSFYVTYLAYRNLKSYLPFLRPEIHDVGLLELEKSLFFGTDPATLLQDVLGTGFAAYPLSAVYLAFLTFVPVSIGAALIWSRRVGPGLWYVTALSLNWMLGALSYYLIPSRGPFYVAPSLFSDLPETGVTRLQEVLLDYRVEVLLDPHSSDAVQSIAAFASLHVAVVFTAALIAHLLGLPRLVRVGLWAFLGLTSMATVYFGWHYIVDDFAGLAIGFVAVYVAARMTGFDWRPLAGRRLAGPQRTTSPA